MKENVDLVKVLLKSKADVEAEFTNWGASIPAREQGNRDRALHIAARNGYFATCKVLLDHGADALATNFNGKTSRMLARSKYPSNSALIDLLQRRL